MLQIRTIEAHLRLGILDLRQFSNLLKVPTKRDLERSGTRLLLSRMISASADCLYYDLMGKPFLKARAEHISISHSHDYLGILLNDKQNTGLDIELIRDKVLNIQQKFLSPAELTFANNDVERLVTMWAAKEALYKIYGLKEIEFKTNIFLNEFSGDEIIGTIKTNNFEKRFLLKQETFDNYKLVYASHEL